MTMFLLGMLAGALAVVVGIITYILLVYGNGWGHVG